MKPKMLTIEGVVPILVIIVMPFLILIALAVVSWLDYLGYM